MMPKKWLNMPCRIQDADEASGYVAVDATENEHGLDLHRIIPGDPEDDLGDSEDQEYWGRLSLAGWRELCEMFALRHPVRFARIVENWKALLQATRQERE